MNKTSWMVAAALGLAAFSVQAQETASPSAVQFTGSGFMTLGVAKMFGGTRQSVGDFDCPCFASDYAQAGVFTGSDNWQWKPDTKLGVQGEASMDNRRYSVSGQLVSRGARNGSVNLEWLYGSYKINDSVTLQVGRKRLPMFYFSDTQDIGVAFPWTHLPPQLYGWEAVNYNGANLLMQHRFGDWSATANVLAGAESIKDAGYDRIYYGRRSQTDAHWKHIVGGDLTLQKDWFETRLVFIQSRTDARIVTGIWDEALRDYDPATAESEFSHARQRIHGLAFNVDYDDWLGRSEWVHITRPGLDFKDFSYILAVGKRIGKWQVMATRSRYWGSAVAEMGNDPSWLEGHATNSLTMRYDLSISSALKVQLDFQRDQSGSNWGIANDSNSATGSGRPYGNANLLSLTYDVVF